MHKDNAFFNILHDSEGTSANSSALKVRRKSSMNNFQSKDKEITNKEQLAEMQDSSSNQSSNLNNIVKSKPKIFKKDYKNQNNIFIDVLQNSEFNVPTSRTSSISKSPKPTERKDSSTVKASLDNQSESNDYTLSFESVSDLSHFPVPKAQSTAFEDSTPRGSSKNDSNSGIEQEIMKKKPKLLKRRTRSMKKNIYKNIFIPKEGNEETEGNVLASKNVMENTEIPQRSSTFSSNDLHKISHKSQENIINEDENKGTEVSSLRKKRKSTILAEQNIKNYSKKDLLGKNVVTANDRLNDSIASSDIPPQPPISLIQEKAEKKNLSSLDNNVKHRNAKGTSTLDQTISKNSSDEEIVDKYVDKVPDASQRLSVPKDLSSFSKEQQGTEKNSKKSSSRNNNLTLSVNRTQDMDSNTSNVNNKGVRSQNLNSISSEETVNRSRYIEKSTTALGRKSAGVSSSSNGKQHNDLNTNTSNVVENVREVENEVSSDSTDEDILSRFRRISQRRSVANVSSSINKKKDSNVKGSSRVSFRVSNLVLSAKESTSENTDAASTVDEDVRDIERVSQAIGNEESLRTSQHTDTENRRRTSSRISNLALSTNKIENVDSKSSGVNGENAKEIEDESSSDTDYDVLIHRPDPCYEETAANTSSNINSEEHSVKEKHRKSLRIISDVMLPTKGSIRSHEVFSKTGNEKTPKKQQSMSQRESVSLNHSTKKRGDAKNLGRASSRSSNLVLSTTESTRVNTNASNIGDEGIIEAVEEASNDSANEQVPNELQQPDKNTDTFQRESGANASPALNKKEQDNVEYLRKVSNRHSLSFLKTPTNKDKSKSKGQMSIKKFVSWRNIVVDEEKMKKVRDELDKIKKEETEKMNANLKQDGAKSSSTVRKNITKRNKSVKPKEKKVHKAYLVNGAVYKVPRLPRPKPWVTDRLYRHLWKAMEPKYNLETRIISEKFVRQLTEVTSHIVKQKSYKDYKDELRALMKEMARLGIIRTPKDFYDFCFEFFPYELREKMVPMLLPGNIKNIPFDPNTVYKPLLDS